MLKYLKSLFHGTLAIARAELALLRREALRLREARAERAHALA